MFDHQYNFDIKIPDELISDKKHEEVNIELLNNKSVLGLVGYAKSGKDTIAKRFIDDYGYHRVAFADNIKKEMNEYLKEAVYNDLMKGHEPIHFKLEDVDFRTDDLNLKPFLRPYIIWYGEKLRELNGPYYWINKALKVDATGHDKIILSDVRRVKELDLFRFSNQFHKKSVESFVKAGISNRMPDLLENKKPYSALLFHVSQFGLTDKDVLTHECIRVAQEEWMFNHTFYIDPRIPQFGKDRDKAIDVQIKEVISKLGIEKPDHTVAWGRQQKMF